MPRTFYTQNYYAQKLSARIITPRNRCPGLCPLAPRNNSLRPAPLAQPPGQILILKQIVFHTSILMMYHPSFLGYIYQNDQSVCMCILNPVNQHSRYYLPILLHIPQNYVSSNTTSSSPFQLCSIHPFQHPVHSLQYYCHLNFSHLHSSSDLNLLLLKCCSCCSNITNFRHFFCLNF